MLFAPPAALAAVVLSSIGAKAADWKTDKAASSSPIVKGKYIVEYRGDASRKRDVDVHAHFDSHMKRADVPYEVKTTFDAAGLFVGASISLSDGDVEAVRAMASVEAVYPVRLVPRPRPYNDVVTVVEGPASNPTDTYIPHRMTGVDKLHNMGIYGKGVLVAEIDTGVDYTHPALGNGCFGRPECKVVKGYDFVGDAYDGTNEPVPDDDPMDCGGHGTHVAGILVADQSPLNFTGVAPQASLAVYRVFGCAGSSQNDVIMEAMIRAYQDGADIISMSLGGPNGWSQTPEAILATRLIELGVVMSLANGNDGLEGLFFVSEPATAVGSLAVASVDSLVIPATAIVIAGQPYEYKRYGNEPGLDVGTEPLPVYVPSFELTDAANFGCDPFDVDLAGKVVILRRGVCGFVIKAQNVLDAGGEVMLVLNNAPGLFNPNVGTVDVQVAALLQSDGPAIFAALQADAKATATFPRGYFNFENKATPGLVSDFSTYGLTNDAYLKPSVAAPGGNILSTYPVAKGSYSVMSGTSMATPYLSGVAALFISQHGRVDPAVLKSIFETTTTPVMTTLGGSQLQTIAQQGGGLINAYDAVLFKTIVSPSEFNLGDSASAVGSGQITIENAGSSTVSYRISHIAASAALTFGENGAQPNLGPATLVEGAATVSFDSTFVTVAAGGSASVTVTFARPTNLDAATIPVFSGHIRLEATDGQSFNIPYAGVAASMQADFPILDTTAEYFEQTYGISVEVPLLMDSDGNFVGETTEFTFAEGASRPEIFFRLLGPAAKILVDLVDASTTFAPTFTRRSLLDGRRMHKIKRAQPATPAIVGGLLSYDLLVRDVPDSTENGVGFNNVPLSSSEEGFAFANGTQVPNGSYKVLLRALKIFGDETDADSYESWLSPVINIASVVPPSGMTNSTVLEPSVNVTLSSNSTASTTVPAALNETNMAPLINGTANSTSSALP